MPIDVTANLNCTDCSVPYIHIPSRDKLDRLFRKETK